MVTEACKKNHVTVNDLAETIKEVFPTDKKRSEKTKSHKLLPF
jgi:hypothetical protein